MTSHQGLVTSGLITSDYPRDWWQHNPWNCPQSLQSETFFEAGDTEQRNYKQTNEWEIELGTKAGSTYSGFWGIGGVI